VRPGLDQPTKKYMQQTKSFKRTLAIVYAALLLALGGIVALVFGLTGVTDGMI